MTYRGVVKNGVIILSDREVLAEGTEVSVRPLNTNRRAAADKKPLARPGRRLMKYAGKARRLPADAARNLDHYLYGHTKR